MELWHNPRCSKSRQAKAILDDRGVAYSERRYLDDPPTAAELDVVLTALGLEPVAKELGLPDEPRDRARWLAIMAAHPVLIERPILIADDGRAVLGRPPEAVAGLLG